MRRTYVVDDGIGTVPELGATLLTTAVVSFLLTIATIPLLPGLAAAIIGYVSFRFAGWSFAGRNRRATIDEEGATFVMDRDVRQVAHADVEEWLVEMRQEGAVLVARTTEGRDLSMLTVAHAAASSLRRLGDSLAMAGTQDRPDGGYRQAPNEARARGRDVEVVRWPSGARGERAWAVLFLVLWPVIWTGAALVFEAEGPRVPVLVWPAAILGAVALGCVVSPSLRPAPSPSTTRLSRWLRFPRTRSAGWSFAVIGVLGSAALFAYEIRPLLHETNVQACDGGDGESCWWAAKKMLLRGEELEAIPYLERACHGGVGDACHFRALRIERLDSVRAQAMLDKGCALRDVTSCVMLASFMKRRGEAARAEAAATRACALDAAQCKH